MLVAIVLTGLVPYTALDVPDPIAVGVDATGLRWLSPLVKLGAIAGLSTVILVGMLAQSRIFYTMAHDGLLPPWVGQLHPRFRTPHRITVVTGVVMAVLAALTPIGVLGELVSMGTLLTFVIVCGGIIILRRTRPELPRPFRTPVVAGGAGAGDADLRLSDVGTARRHLASPVRLAGRGNGRLPGLRPAAQQGATAPAGRTDGALV